MGFGKGRYLHNIFHSEIVTIYALKNQYHFAFFESVMVSRKIEKIIFFILRMLPFKLTKYKMNTIKNESINCKIELKIMV